MASILLSFVGQQDPVSDNTHEDGSIVSLIRHLVAEGQPIKKVLLLYTQGTQDRAELTQGWLSDPPLNLVTEAIALVPVEPGLSDDPVDVWLAVQSARQGLELALATATAQDTLELNGSSGTPVMKSAWSILQAAGYAPKSRLWQVRNPKEQQPGQARVFQTNIQVLRQEFDRQVIRQQLQDYNYNGALTTLQTAGLATPVAKALAQYGHCRLSLDFASAKQALLPELQAQWQPAVDALLCHHPTALMKEAYFNAVVELKNHKYSDFLVRMSQFLEISLECLVDRQLGGQPALPQTFSDTPTFWTDLAHSQPDLYQSLRTATFKGNSLRLEAFPNRPVLLEILTYGGSPVLESLKTLSIYCDQRNRYIHRFEGISALEDAEVILKTLRRVLEHLGQSDFTNPFNQLNQAILASLVSAPPPS